jgi:hypothetical protein
MRRRESGAFRKQLRTRGHGVCQHHELVQGDPELGRAHHDQEQHRRNERELDQRRPSLPEALRFRQLEAGKSERACDRTARHPFAAEKCRYFGVVLFRAHSSAPYVDDGADRCCNITGKREEI